MTRGNAPRKGYQTAVRPIDPAFFEDNDRQAPAGSGVQLAQIGSLTCQSGVTLPEVQVAYQTWGTLNAERSNAVLVCHALSGDSNVLGWWERLFGAGRAIDPADWFVIGTNALGGCQGTTGPGSLAQDGKPWGSRFPKITVADMVVAQTRLLDQLGIDRLALVCGGSMGGMQALEWTLTQPDRVARLWMTASARAHSAMQIAFNEAARQAVMRDPAWQNGDYDGEGPQNGLAVARMVGHLSYLSDAAFTAKFGRGLQPPTQDAHEGQFQVESYLNYQGEKFGRRFDARSLVALTWAIDRYEATAFRPLPTKVLLTSYTSDWLYPTWQSEELAAQFQAHGVNCRHHEIDQPYGHDSFLLDGEEQGRLLRDWLAEG